MNLSEASSNGAFKQQPVPVDKEIKIEPVISLVSKCDIGGHLEFVNDDFIEISGYSEAELMGKSQDVIYHPDMPALVFKIMKDSFGNQRSTIAILKNLAKNGRYFWTLAELEIKRNKEGVATHYFMRQKGLAKTVIDEIDQLYEKLKQIESHTGIGNSEKYFIGYLEDIGKSYLQYVNDISGNIANQQDKIVVEKLKLSPAPNAPRSGLQQFFDPNRKGFWDF